MSKIYVDEIAPKTTGGQIIMPKEAGTVLQTVYAEYTTATNITSGTKGSGTSTGLSVTITPQYADSKLLINYVGSFNLANHSNPWVSIEIYDGSSVVATDENVAIYINGDGNEYDNNWKYPFMAFITPSSTNAITYTVRAWKSGNACTAQHGSRPSSISIQEIKQ